MKLIIESSTRNFGAEKEQDGYQKAVTLIVMLTAKRFRGTLPKPILETGHTQTFSKKTYLLTLCHLKTHFVVLLIAS